MGNSQFISIYLRNIIVINAHINNTLIYLHTYQISYIRLCNMIISILAVLPSIHSYIYIIHSTLNYINNKLNKIMLDASVSTEL